MADVTINQAKKQAADLALSISALLQEYEKSTGALIHSVPVIREKTAVSARVKVQLP
jgi:hypothetical protein